MSRSIVFNQKVHNVCELLLQKELESWQAKFVQGCMSFGQHKMYLTGKQSKLLGGLSKQYLQNGQFEQGTWWDDSLVVRHMAMPNLPNE